MRGLIQIWRDLGDEMAAEFDMSLKTRIEDGLLSMFSLLAVVICITVLTTAWEASA